MTYIVCYEDDTIYCEEMMYNAVEIYSYIVCRFGLYRCTNMSVGNCMLEIFRPELSYFKPVILFTQGMINIQKWKSGSLYSKTWVFLKSSKIIYFGLYC